MSSYFSSIWGIKKYISHVSFPVYGGLNALWSIGFLLSCGMGFQMITGILFAFNLNGLGSEYSLNSKMFMFMEINQGWLVTLSHSIFPTFLSFLLFLHVLSVFIFPIYYFSSAWVSGFLLYVIYMAVCLTGYVLVCGSMGFWAAMVVKGILSFLSLNFSDIMMGLPDTSVRWVFSVYSYHYLLTMLLAGLSMIHVFLNHLSGCAGLTSYFMEMYPFMSLMLSSDFLSLIVGSFVTSMSICFFPEYFYSSDNYLDVDIMSVPSQINAEWYVSVYFIMLKSIDSKSLGMMFMFVFAILFFISFYSKDVFGFAKLEGCWSGFMVFSLLAHIIMMASNSFGGILYSNGGLILGMAMLWSIEWLDSGVIYVLKEVSFYWGCSNLEFSNYFSNLYLFDTQEFSLGIYGYGEEYSLIGGGKSLLGIGIIEKWESYLFSFPLFCY